jgi:HAD superfamily hydrolase (TIGR01459 family)
VSRPAVSGGLGGLAGIARRYDLMLCDVFGVVHDAERVHPAAVDALACARRGGASVVLVSNSASPGPAVASSLQARGIGPDACDAVVTSADVARDLIRGRGARAVIHIGPAREAAFLDDFGVALASVEEAELVVCTGLEEPQDEGARAVLLAVARRRGLTLVCTNPDRTAETPRGTLRFAGLIAEAYAALGGAVVLTGKPDPSIYEAALAAAARVRGGPVAPGRVLAIGDTYALDVAGAVACGFDALWITPDGADDPRPAIPGPWIGRMPTLAW